MLVLFHKSYECEPKAPTLKRIQQTFSKEVNYLVITIDHKLTVNSHIDKVFSGAMTISCRCYKIFGVWNRKFTADHIIWLSNPSRLPLWFGSQKCKNYCISALAKSATTCSPGYHMGNAHVPHCNMEVILLPLDMCVIREVVVSAFIIHKHKQKTHRVTWNREL